LFSLLEKGGSFVSVSLFEEGLREMTTKIFSYEERQYKL
jgi:hypothetical protein